MCVFLLRGAPDVQVARQTSLLRNSAILLLLRFATAATPASTAVAAVITATATAIVVPVDVIVVVSVVVLPIPSSEAIHMPELPLQRQERFHASARAQINVGCLVARSQVLCTEAGVDVLIG